MRRASITAEELPSQLRQFGIDDVEEIEMAMLEDKGMRITPEGVSPLVLPIPHLVRAPTSMAETDARPHDRGARAIMMMTAVSGARTIQTK